MIEQYLSQTNESATVPVLQKILELNKAGYCFRTKARADFTQKEYLFELSIIVAVP